MPANPSRQEGATEPKREPGSDSGLSPIRWRPVDDLPDDWRSLVSEELQSLSKIWTEQAAKLQKSRDLKAFNDRLAREWAIETGIIEKLYSIERGTTQLLIERGIHASLIEHGKTDKPAELVVAMVKAQQEALEGLFAFVTQQRALTTSYIKQLHQIMTRNQDVIEALNGGGKTYSLPMTHGEWKRLPNNPTRQDGTIHEYCPPLQVAGEMECLVRLHGEHSKVKIPPEVEAAWLHHRFTQIHPFQDGNGRIARALATLVFLRDGWFPLVVRNDRRAEYIHALESADQGNLAELVRLFVGIQRQAFIQALSISEDVVRGHAVIDQIISATKDRLQARTAALTREYARVFEAAKRIENICRLKLEEAQKSLKQILRTASPRLRVMVDSSKETNGFWFRKQIIETAEALKYFADTRTYRTWHRLRMTEDRQTSLVIAFHALGVSFAGTMAACAFIEFKDRTEAGETTTSGPFTLCREAFQFSYAETVEGIEARFLPWLNEVIGAGLDQWRRQM